MDERSDVTPPRSSAGGLRLFFSAVSPDRLRERLARLQRQICSGLPADAWQPVHPLDLHLTLRFLGAVPSERLETLQALLTQTASAHLASFPLATGLAAWPAASPRLVVLELDCPAALRSLAESLEQGLRALGFAAEPRDFRPHVTLVRARRGHSASLGQMPKLHDIGTHGLQLEVTRLALQQSVADGTVPRYRVLDDAPLGLR